MNKKAIILTALCVLALNGCKTKDPVPTPEPTPQDGYFYVRQHGEPVKNPTNSKWCKPETAEATLSSLRRISDRFYYMNYLTDMQLDNILAGNYRTRDAFDNAINESFFTQEGIEHSGGNINPSACSGFVCHNEKGEILLGRNFDGNEGPLLLLFNKANGAKFVEFSDPIYNSLAMYFNPVTHTGDGVLSNGETSLHRLLCQPLSTMDGMNEYGLCFGAFQLPKFDSINIMPVHQNNHNDAMGASLFHNLILSKCKTVKEVEQFASQHDFVSNNMVLNVHWLMADATGDWAILEFWKDTLHVYREIDLQRMCVAACNTIPYEWYSIENYYRSWEPYSAFPKGEELVPYNWQVVMSMKLRVTHMMNAYKPVMSEMEALQCLQQGRYDLEVPNHLTNWSCIYNPAQRTVIFALRNDMSTVYKIDLKKDL